MKKQLNEVQKFQKIAGILKEEDFNLPDESSFDNPNIVDGYDMEDGIGLPEDGGVMANKFREAARNLGMKEGAPNMMSGAFFFGYERGDTAETADPSYIVIVNPEMQADENIRELVKQCIENYD